MLTLDQGSSFIQCTAVIGGCEGRNVKVPILMICRIFNMGNLLCLDFFYTRLMRNMKQIEIHVFYTGVCS